MAKIEAERGKQTKKKQINKKSLVYTMEEIIYEEEDIEAFPKENKDIVTDDEIEEEIEASRKHSLSDNIKDISESSDIPEEVNDEQDDEIPEAIEGEEDLNLEKK